eukprot:TRINITY_DN1507_c0_g1_i1.p1 TRINITY_DN1507_c0_g1~~TRINITY_DN1507_c0_g1_i1.p1  ORF type:complete len:453 (+),score=28.10 TRINITY_DN1507_c0_g1_i1:61-1419(+)
MRERKNCCCGKPTDLRDWNNLPAYLRDNPYILSGYRVNLGLLRSVKSLFELHNESMNVWSHLLAVFGLALLLVLTAFWVSPYGIDRIGLSVPASTTTHNIPSAQPFFASLLSTTEQPANETASWQQAIAQSEFMLILQSRLPDMAKLTDSLRRAVNLASDASQKTKEAFSTYLGNVETRLKVLAHELKGIGGEIASPVHYEVLRNAIRENGGAFIHMLTRKPMDWANFLVSEFQDRFGMAVDLILPAGGSIIERLSRWPINVFIVSAILCCLFSSVFHLFTSASESVSAYLQRLDYAGISLLISGSNIPVIYYGFYCHPKSGIFYTTLILVMGISAFLFTSLERFASFKYRKIKVIVFIAMGLFGLVILMHMMLLGINLMCFWLVSIGVIYISGAMIYMFHFPERLAPGFFDLFFSSHQLWHCMIVTAIIVHFLGVREFYEWRILHACASSP